MKMRHPWLTVMFFGFWLLYPAHLSAEQRLPCSNLLSPEDALLVADHSGHIRLKINEDKKCIPASTLKLLTALAAIHYLGLHYRFHTEFYMDIGHNLKIKGYGDPLLISEAWQEIADHLIKKIHGFRDLVLDDTYFSERIVNPGRAHSTNPYDAPVGALCANFNTVFFDRDEQGKIISAEPQTPMIPFVRERILSLGQKRGRHTFSRDSLEASQYAGNLLLHFLKERGAECQGRVRSGRVGPKDRLILTYRSGFTLKQVLEKMMKFSNNFIANQIFLALGARKYGAPATLQKGVKAVFEYARKELGLKGIKVVEGSGISRKNRISAGDMLTILQHFRPYRHILKKKGGMVYKTGSLRGIRTRAGYIGSGSGVACYFVIFLNSGNTRMDDLLTCLRSALAISQYFF